jgi:phosphoglycerol transferase MdoB-like AlkP superfamily enzyme
LKTIARKAFLLIIFWFCVFALNRIVFYCCTGTLLQGVSFNLILQSFWHALRLDLSMIGYLTALPFLLYLVYFLILKKSILVVSDYFNYFLIILYNLAAFGELCLYREWKAKLSMQALQHFRNPEEVFKSASIGLTLLFFSLTIIFSWLYIRIYKRKISFTEDHSAIPSQEMISGSTQDESDHFSYAQDDTRVSRKTTLFSKTVIGICMLVAISAFSIISIRGGLQQIPIQSSDSFFSTTPIVNDVAVNPLWNITFNIMEYENHFKDNPYKDFPQAEADRITRELYSASKDTTVEFLTNKRPNIVFFLLESWSAYTVSSFGGDNFAPFIDSLSKEGIRFTKAYPAGYVSDQGIPAVLSGYPAVSRIAVINESSKSVPLPCINQDLKPYGYESGFIFGGDLNYGNIRSYVYNKKFDIIREEKDFESEIPRGKLGIQDKEMAAEYLTLLNAAKAPFVYTWFTLSSHMPYDFGEEKKQLVKTENDYINSVAYSDAALKEFFVKAKTQPWYNNTLFVLVADHSHASHRELNVYDAEYHRIPMVFFGNVIDMSFRGKAIEHVVSQLDITHSLLKQMDLDKESEQYQWSKNMFNPYSKHFAFYCSYSGAGFVTDEGYIGFQHGLKELIFNTLESKKTLADSLTMYGKAFQQSVYEDYRLK